MTLRVLWYEVGRRRPGLFILMGGGIGENSSLVYTWPPLVATYLQVEQIIPMPFGWVLQGNG